MAGDFDKEKLVKMGRSVVPSSLCIVIVVVWISGSESSSLSRSVSSSEVE